MGEARWRDSDLWWGGPGIRPTDQKLLGPWDGEFLVRWLASPHLAGRIPEPSPGAFMAWGEMPEERRRKVGELGCMLGFRAEDEPDDASETC